MNNASRLDLFDWYDATSDQVKCLECNKWMCAVTLHLRKHHMTPQEYRERWGIFKTTPLMNKELIRIASERMVKMRETGKAVVSPKGIAPPQLQGLDTGFKRTDYKEFDEQRKNTSVINKGKLVSEETRRKNSLSHKGKPAWNKSTPVTRLCERDQTPFTCMQWQPNKYCSKRCAMLSNENWKKRKVLLNKEQL